MGRNHRHGPDIDAIPELAAVFAELRTEEVQSPPRGYATVERILLPDGSCIHESSQYGFAEVVARWLWANGYRAEQGPVAAYEASERYLAGDCGMGDGWVSCNRRRVIAGAITAERTGRLASEMWGAGLVFDGALFVVATAGNEVDALARAVERLMSNGYRVGMARQTAFNLLAADHGSLWDYKPTRDDAPWICDLRRARALRPRADADGSVEMAVKSLADAAIAASGE